MVKMTSFMNSLVFLVAGFLGLTNLLPIFETYPVLSNIGAIIFGVLGLLISIYTGRNRKIAVQRREHSQQQEANVQLRKETFDQARRESEQLKSEIEQLKKENGQLRNKT